ncbi:nucleoside recognition domain-containing protein [Cohnella endophytica]|uniref:Nucleoside recognition domain-containing protein n=1 Tax=Cohnella endophytica TaxID=2419778 RepID=A0A494Y083_9BACL|nr:nucleoside recognition domain-containing protein [Cohnella endophytica]RKP55408.1 nucleoside recognition domain-containing protein [Cohnella endophytica]
MDNPAVKKNPVFLSLVLGAAALSVVVGIVHSPGEAFSASLSGLQIWWQNVFPGLLPPLILAELLAASGLLHGISTLAEPLTRGLFRLPGSAGWAIAFGWAAGIPAGAKETARLRDNGLIQDDEIDTVLLVSHLPNPFLVVLVIGCGFLQSPELGWSIAIGLWTSALIAGYWWARIGKPRKPKVPHIPVTQTRALLVRALRASADARKEDGRPLGKQLADSVTNAVGTLMTLGGLMIMSAVVIRLVQLFIPGNDLWLAFPGFYEMNLGAYESSRSALFSSAPAQGAALIACVLAWSGWSGLLQARAAFGSGAFPWLKVIASRLLHGAIALVVTYFVASAASSVSFKNLALGPWSVRWPATEAWVAEGPMPSGWGHLTQNLAIALVSFGIFLLLALLAAIIRPKPPKPHKSPPSSQPPME